MPEERILAWRTRGQYWGRERAVVVTYNPATARKQAYTLESQLDELRAELLLMRARVRQAQPHWRDPEKVRERYLAHCQRLHLASALFTLEFTTGRGNLNMSFRADAYALKKKRVALGKNIIITDNTDWSAAEIAEASRERWQVEERFGAKQGRGAGGGPAVQTLDRPQDPLPPVYLRGGDDLSAPD